MDAWNGTAYFGGGGEMTHEQLKDAHLLRARCKKLIDSIYGPRADGNMGASYDEYVQEAESLCREMIAVGLERAAVRLP